jgi:heterodisulfide reductase subunit C
MAKLDFDLPKLGPNLEIPVLQPDAMLGDGPFVAKPDHQDKLGFPGELVDDWQQVAIDKMGELLGKYRSFKVYLDSCVKCGACTDKCHYFLGTGDPKNMPVARQDLLRSVYRRYFTFAGKHFPKLVGARDLTEDVLDEWYNYFHQCSQCRRCSVFCPYGIDTAEISMAARDIMDAVGKGQKYCNEIIGKVHKIGNNLGLPEPALIDTLEGLEEDIKDDTGIDVKLPVDVQGAEVMLVTPSADFFAEPHIDGLIGYAKVFHQAGISWTISSYASEAANFGRPRLARRLQLPEHAGRTVRLPRQPLPGATAHLRVDQRPDRSRRSEPRPVGQRRQSGHLPRLVQRRARLAHGRPAGRSVRDPARGDPRLGQPLRGHGRRDHPRPHLLLRRRRRPAHR